MSWIEKTAQRIWPGRQAPHAPSDLTKEQTLAKIEKGKYSSNIIGILEKLVSICPGTDRKKIAFELLCTQVTLRSVFEDCIADFKQYAQASGTEWQGIVQGPHDSNEQDGLCWDYSQTLAIKDQTICYQDIKDEAAFGTEIWGVNGEYLKEILLEGSPDGRAVTQASYNISKTQGYESDRKETTIKLMSVTFGSPGEPSEVHFISRPDPVKNRYVTQSLEYHLILGPQIAPAPKPK